MCPYFFRLSLSSFYTKVLNINYITSFTLTILTLCVIIFLKTVIIFIPTIYALNFHWFHKTLYISKIQTQQSNLQIVTADFFCDTCHHFFSHHHSIHLPFLCSKRHCWLVFSSNEPPPQQAFSCHFQSANHPFLHVFGEHGCINRVLFAVFWGPFLFKKHVKSRLWIFTC